MCVCGWGTGQVAARYDRDVTVGAIPPLLCKRPCICITRTAVALQDCLSICLTELLPLASCQMHYSTCDCEANWLHSKSTTNSVPEQHRLLVTKQNTGKATEINIPYCFEFKMQSNLRRTPISAGDFYLKKIEW
jgi:hypothetical protein